ncbi:MAG: hypothetical protein Q7K44_03610 [Candidatus Liptonbacteria bacterium]|nr:hypothetical protein [Candidatus Liptonbacteria bacterium]
MNKNWLKENWLKIGVLIGIIWGILFFWNNENWTLMICKEKLNDAECYSTSYVISGFKSSKECLLEGASKFKKEGFECGKNCKENDGGLKICNEICNSAGCR